VSSNSSADRPARRLLGAAFDVLRAEAPAHHEALCAALAVLAVNVDVAQDRLAPRVIGGRLAVDDPVASPDVAVRTTLAATCALLDGHRTLVDAVAHGELDIHGRADALDAAAAAFSLFLHGLVRAPSSPRLLDELRDHVAREIDHGQTVSRL
jgi:hypothetical protein